ncbi:hypothetical protein VaNZ11_005253 [Volvox africanus]|uniref:Uncharacterized protein n=1 Tax=Volvox africanus TaxID=51714 RepID=A0ABQ5RYN8_9CHLO|nr:hypothetical protein VaNZ11_005253 [Volvox africanus]
MPHPLRPPSLLAARPHREHGLEWLPASPAAPPLHDRSLTSTSTSTSAHPRPLLVILPWMWASRAALARHITLYHSLGCDVAVFYGWPALSVWVPLLAQRNAAKLLAALAAHLRDQPRDIVLACYSGAAKGVLCPLMERMAPGAAVVAAAAAAATAVQPGPVGAALGELVRPVKSHSAAESVTSASTAGVPAVSHARFVLSFLPNMIAAGLRRVGATSPQEATQQQEQQRSPPQPPPLDPSAALLLRHLRSIIFESGPVDFDSSVGVRLFATSRHPTLRSLQATAGAAAAGTLDFCLYEMFEGQRRAMWASLRSSLVAAHLPVLFLYSWSGDVLADPQPIHALAVALRSEATLEPATAAAGATIGAGSACRDLDAEAAVVADDKSAHEGGRSTSECFDGGCVRICSGSRIGGDSDCCFRVPDAITETDFSPSCATGDGSMVKCPQPHIGSGLRCGAGGQCDGGAASTARRSCRGAATAATTVLCCPRHRMPAHGAVPLRVWEQGWDFSPHVAHLRDHPEQYRRVVAAFLDSCLGTGPAESVATAGAEEGAVSAGGADSSVGTPAGVIARIGKAAVSRL